MSVMKQRNNGNVLDFNVLNFTLNLLLLGLCTHADSLFFEAALLGI